MKKWGCPFPASPIYTCIFYFLKRFRFLPTALPAQPSLEEYKYISSFRITYVDLMASYIVH